MSVMLRTVTLVALAAGLASCGPPASREQVDAPSLQPASAASPPSVGLPQVSSFAEDAAISVHSLIDLAKRFTPNRAVFEANREAAAALVVEARAWANPELELSAGRARYREGDNPAVSIGGVSLKQRFELPGKRSARIDAAEAGRLLAERTAAVDGLALEGEVRQAVVGIAAAELRREQADKAHELAVTVQGIVAQRLAAGETDRGDLTRTNADLAISRLEVDSARRDAEAARAVVRLWCGGQLPQRFTVPDAVTDVVPEIPLAAMQQAALAAHPRLAVLDAQAAAVAGELNREERAWYPDLTVGVFGDRGSDTNDLGVTLGVEVPVWNRNQGGIAQARAEIARLAAERRNEQATVQRQVLAAWSRYDGERQQITGLASEVVPATEESLRLKLLAYASGDVALFDILEARRAAFAAQQALLNARVRAATARIELAAAIGSFADPSQVAPASSINASGNAP